MSDLRAAIAALFVLGAGLSALPAAAQTVKAQDPKSLVSALEAAGYSTTMGVDATGDPKIESSVGDTKFVILFYNCTDHKECATVQFHAGYDFKKSPGLDLINEWNRSQRFGRAYLDKEDDPILQMDLDLDDGGMSRALFTDNVEFWASVVKGFEKHIGYAD